MVFRVKIHEMLELSCFHFANPKWIEDNEPQMPINTDSLSFVEISEGPSSKNMGKILLPVLAALAVITLCSAGRRVDRSIDLSAAHSLISDSRLPGEIIPGKNYSCS